jgi:hypothetical protein
MKRLLVLLSAMLLIPVGYAFAHDLDNNGIQGDENYVPGVFNGNADRDETVAFPTSGDTWSVYYYPYWWHAGDTVYGTHSVTFGCVTHVDLVFKISYNVLSGTGHVDLDFRINGTTVGSFSALPSDGTGFIYRSFDFPPMTPPFELRYYETNTVDPGAGSISIDETGLCTATFNNGGTPVEPSTWGQIKSLFQ